jgi:hypothetical protein
MLTIESVKNLVWSNTAKTACDAVVKFKEFDEDLPFTICEWDIEPHGIELYAKLKAGEYGAPSAFVPLPAPTPATAEQKLKNAGLSVDELKTLLGI